jgi:hypothetical protein
MSSSVQKAVGSPAPDVANQSVIRAIAAADAELPRLQNPSIT